MALQVVSMEELRLQVLLEPRADGRLGSPRSAADGGSRARRSTSTGAATWPRGWTASSRARAGPASRRRGSSLSSRRGSSRCAGNTRAGARAGSGPSFAGPGSTRPPSRRSTRCSRATIWSRRDARGGRRPASASSASCRTTSGRSTARRWRSPQASASGSSTSWTTTPATCSPPSPPPVSPANPPGPASWSRPRSTACPASCSPTTAATSPGVCSASKPTFERRLAVDVRGRTDKVKRSETAAPPRRRVRRRVDHGLDTGNSRDGASPVPRSPCTHSTSVLVPGRRASKTHPMTLVLQQRDDRTAPDVRCLQSRESSFPTSCRRVPTSVL